MSNTVFIKSKSHPHSGEIGILSDEQDMLERKLLPKMYKIELDDCPHGVQCCYAAEKDIYIKPTQPPATEGDDE